MYIVIYTHIYIYVYMHVFLRSAMILRPNSWGLFWQLVDIGGTAEAKRKEQPVQQPGQAAQCQAALFKGADRTGGKMYSPQRKERRKRQCACIKIQTREHMININQWVAILKASPTLVFFFAKTANPCEKISRLYELVNTSSSSTTRQVERAAKTARSEGPPVKKQPVPAKVPWSSRAGRKYDDSGGVNGDLMGYIGNNLECCRYAIC